MSPIAARRARLVACYLVCSLPFIGYGALQSLSSNANSPLDWVPHTFKARADYDSFCRDFGSGDTVLLSWAGCTVREPSLDRLTKLLRESPSFQLRDGVSSFESVSSGRELAQQLASGAAPLDAQQVSERFRGSLIGPDGATTFVAITFRPAALLDRKRLVSLIQTAVERECGIPRRRQHLVGPVIDGLSVDVASKATLDRLAGPSAGVCALLICLCLKSFRGGLFVFGIALFSQAAVLALMFYCGESLSALLIVLPPLLQVLAVAGGIHLANYYFDCTATHGVEEAPREMVRAGWVPTSLSLGTTAIGMSSLLVSQVTPVRAFGAFAAAGTLLILGLLLGALPTLFTLFPVRSRARLRQEIGSEAEPPSGVWSQVAAAERWGYWGIIVSCVGTMLACGWGFRDLQASVRLSTLFAANSRIIQDYRWFERHIGAVVPIEVVVTFDESSVLSPTERLAMVKKLDVDLREIPTVSTTVSAMQFLPMVVIPREEPIVARTRRIEQVLALATPALESVGRLRVEGDCERWRVTGFVSAVDEIDYSKLLTQVKRQSLPAITSADGAAIPGVSLNCTGIMPLVHEIQHQLMQDLLMSYLSAFALIGLVMTIAQGGFWAGLIAMIPNVFPSLIVFGLLGWYKASIDIGTVMTASIALGMAVDDTLHYTTFFRRALGHGMSRADAVLWTYRHCGTAMIQTSLACIAGLAVFAFSDFVPTLRFSYVMIAMVLLALFGDVVLLPALLLSPAGALFPAESEGLSPQSVPQPLPPATSEIGTEPDVPWVGYPGHIVNPAAYYPHPDAAHPQPDFRLEAPPQWSIPGQNRA